MDSASALKTTTQQLKYDFNNSMQEGTRVGTSGGVYGDVKRINIESNTVELEIARGVVVTVDRNYVFADPASLQSVNTKN